MALSLFKPDCLGAMPNTGESDCGVVMGVLNGLIFTTTQKAYPSNTTVADLVTAMKADVLAASTKDRLYPFFSILELTADNTQERAKVTAGNGGVTFGAPKARDFRYKCENMGAKYFKKIAQITKVKKLYVFGIDVNGNLICDRNAADEIIPIELQTQCIQEPKYNTDTTVDFFLDIITKSPYAFGSGSEIVELGGVELQNEISGLFDVVLGATGGSLKIDVSATIDVDGRDFFDLYSAEAAVAGAFKVVNGSGAVVVPSAVAAVSGDPTLISLTVPAGTGYSVELESPAALVALNIGSAAEGGYESNKVTGIAVTA